jgi:hypothetical protein
LSFGAYDSAVICAVSVLALVVSPAAASVAYGRCSLPAPLVGLARHVGDERVGRCLDGIGRTLAIFVCRALEGTRIRRHAAAVSMSVLWCVDHCPEVSEFLDWLPAEERTFVNCPLFVRRKYLATLKRVRALDLREPYRRRPRPQGAGAR